MPELISIEEAARITGFPYEEIEDWVKSRKITSFHTRTGTRMVDPENLRDFIAHIEHLGIQKLYLQLVIQDKEEEADEIIAQYDDYLLLQTTERSTVEMKLLPLVNNTYVVCMISTVNGPVPDSRIEFFTTNWEPLATSDLFTQPTSDWYIKQGIDKKDEAYQEAASHLDMDLIQYRLSPDDQTLTAIYTTPQYLSQEAREKIEPYLSEPKVYTWQKYHFQ